MPSTFTTSLRLELQATGENRSTWGTKANTVFSLLEESVAGVASIDMNDDDYTLTTNDGSTDEARNAVLIISGTNTSTHTLTIPTVEKTYIIINSSGQTVTVSNGTNTVDIGDDECKAIITDGTEVYGTHDVFAVLGTASSKDTGTSGAKVPLLNGVNTWSGNQTMSGTLSVAGAVTGASFSGSGASLTGLNASNLSSGTVPSARVSGSYTGFTNVTGTGTATFGTFSGSGASLTNLNASNVSTGTLPAARLPSTVIQTSDTSETTVGGALVKRSAAGDISTRLFRSEYTATNANINFIMTQIETGTGNNYVRPSTPSQVATALTPYLPSQNDASKLTTGRLPTGRLSGTYAISISGNAATATTFDGKTSWETGVASIAAGAVGSIGFFSNQSGATISPGNTTAGSNLEYSGISPGDTSHSGSPAGTWVCLGYCKANYSSVFMRVS